jgi:hypothetical protein
MNAHEDQAYKDANTAEKPKAQRELFVEGEQHPTAKAPLADNSIDKPDEPEGDEAANVEAEKKEETTTNITEETEVPAPTAAAGSDMDTGDVSVEDIETAAIISVTAIATASDEQATHPGETAPADEPEEQQG